MKYLHVVKAKFLERPNRFIALAEVDGCIQKAHVKNTGRCRELLISGTDIFLEENDNPARKTKYSLIAVNKGGRLINMDSQIPNAVVAEYIEKGGIFGSDAVGKIKVRREKTYKDSRFDIYAELENRKIFIEVKGVTLEENDIARFPDAPTERGLKHIRGLMDAVTDGYEAYIVFVIQMNGIKHFEPNDKTQPEFGRALCEAQAAGVHMLAFSCDVTESSIEICDEVPVHLPCQAVPNMR